MAKGSRSAAQELYLCLEPGTKLCSRSQNAETVPIPAGRAVRWFTNRWIRGFRAYVAHWSNSVTSATVSAHVTQNCPRFKISEQHWRTNKSHSEGRNEAKETWVWFVFSVFSDYSRIFCNFSSRMKNLFSKHFWSLMCFWVSDTKWSSCGRFPTELSVLREVSVSQDVNTQDDVAYLIHLSERDLHMEAVLLTGESLCSVLTAAGQFICRLWLDLMKHSQAVCGFQVSSVGGSGPVAAALCNVTCNHWDVNTLQPKKAGKQTKRMGWYELQTDTTQHVCWGM